MNAKAEFLREAERQQVTYIRATLMDGMTADGVPYGMRGVQLFPDLGHNIPDDQYDWWLRHLRGEIEMEPILEL